jgi:DNA repair exonuclease SbcCD ATPase subunit
MKLAFLKAAGFRGIKGEIDLRFPGGFAVVCGRNGSGKSSVCDAVEYAISGAVQRHGAASEGREDVSHYLWWRGDGQPSSRFVTVGFVAEDGRELSITRTPSGVEGASIEELLDQLCERGTAPTDSARQLCLTSLLRDDDITQLSVDLSESERFSFVKNALGGADFSSFEARVKAAYDSLQRSAGELEGEYQRERERVVLLKTQLSQAATRTLSESDIASAKELIAQSLPGAPTDLPSLLSAARNEIAKLRVQVSSLSRISDALESQRQRLSGLVTPEHERRESELRSAIDRLRERVSSLSQRQSGLSQQVAQKEREAPFYTALAQIQEHGSRLGLLDGRCPLCGSAVTAEHFASHLVGLKSTIDERLRELTQLVSNARTAADELRVARLDLANAEEQLRNFLAEPEAVQQQIGRLMADARLLGIIPGEGEELSAILLSRGIEEHRSLLSKIERAVALLDASGALEQVASAQRDLLQTQQKVSEIAERINKAKEAAGKAKETWDCIRRVSGEIVDDRLAELAPLLAELFLRLRPHVDWRDLSYVLRGDVRKFLRLTVGEDLNPRFMFSSGQRRAVGLAFLLAVHLSRPWCRLRSLVLDDPIQHIDDYRALHLVEVLSAIRQLGHQVICTVEDPALADLLCRRLRSLTDAEGTLVELTYVIGQGVKVGRVRDIRPLQQLIVKSA